ncbi:MAG: hypothetical protein J5584_02460 [Clostridia bacterium]|nr:hypothetical protein [Clostridia bacterium]
MKKIRILAIVLIIPLVLSLAACKTATKDKAETAYESYKTALKKTNGLSDVTSSQKVVVDMSISVQGVNVTMKTISTTGSKIKNLLKPDMLMEVHQTQTVEVMGSAQTSKIDMFLDKDNVYVSQDNDPYIVLSRGSEEAKPVNDALESLTDTSGYEFTKDMFKGAKITPEKDGSRKIELTLTNAQLLKLVGDNIDASLAALDELGAKDVKYDFSDVNVSLTIDPDGYITEMMVDCIMNMDMTIEGQKATSKNHLTTSTKNIDIGKAVNITIPDV